MTTKSLSLLLCGLLVACIADMLLEATCRESWTLRTYGAHYMGHADHARCPPTTRWPEHLENYVPRVRGDNQTVLNTARMAFASYLNAIHKRIHPIFADSFLSSLDRLQATHPMNDPRLSTELEIVLNQESGDLVRMGVTRSSGVTAFDIAALESVKRAAPFGPPPPEIVSPDGNVYVHWEFHRNSEACSTFNARPFLLKAQPKAAAN